MNISPFSNEPLDEIADQLGWADEVDAKDNLVSVCILLCKKVAYLEYQISKLKQ